MAKRIGSLKVGDQIRLKFHGSKRLGNEPYELDAEFAGFITGATLDEFRPSFYLDGDKSEVFEAYLYDGRWAYGTSAERLSIV